MSSTEAVSRLRVGVGEVEARARPLRRSALVRRALVAADLVGLVLAFALTAALFGLSGPGAHARPVYELLVFALTLPGWMLLGSMQGLYRRDDERIGHSTVDDFVAVFQVVTLGAWIFFIGCWITGVSDPRPGKLISFWL